MLVTGTTSNRIEAYVQRVADYLGLADTEAFVEVELKKHCDGMAGGYCHGDTDSVYIEIANNDSVGRIPIKDKLINIAHEMIHAQQIATGRLINCGFAFKPDGTTLTTKQIFEDVEYLGVRYDEQPWENEAYALEKTVYEACK